MPTFVCFHWRWARATWLTLYSNSSLLVSVRLLSQMWCRRSLDSSLAIATVKCSKKKPKRSQSRCFLLDSSLSWKFSHYDTRWVDGSRIQHMSTNLDVGGLKSKLAWESVLLWLFSETSSRCALESGHIYPDGLETATERSAWGMQALPTFRACDCEKINEEAVATSELDTKGRSYRRQYRHSASTWGLVLVVMKHWFISIS